MSESTAVLVHGAYHGSWVWENVCPLLDAAGVRHVEVDLPLTGFDDDVSCLAALLEDTPGTKVLVGHSYAGMVISQVADGRDDIGHLVYVTAFLVEPQEDVFAYLTAAVASAAQFNEDGAVVIDPSQAVAVFYQCCDPSVAAEAVKRIRPHRLGGGSQTAAAWRSLPSTYVICKRDAGHSPQGQEAMSARADVVHELDTDHSPMLSKPAETAAIIEAAVRDTARR